MRSCVPCSRPLVRLTIGTHARTNGAASTNTARNPCDGTAITTTSAAASASSSDAVEQSAGGSAAPGRYAEFAWSVAISSATSFRRAHSTVGLWAADSAATVVPHEPAPITATWSATSGSVRTLRRPC